MSIQSTAQAFLQRAHHEVKRYGADRWVFLRELVQNSRDARATRIQVSLTQEEGWTILTCQDNGIGMTRSELTSYLLCLYATNKQYANADVGYFGVGFWSVLLFEPDLIRVTTKSANDSVQGTEIYPTTYELKDYSGQIEGNGTRVSLYKKVAPDASFPGLIRERLEYYAQFVRPRQGVDTLSLEYQGQCLNGPISARMTYGKPFSTRDFDGVIGFGPTPFVRLYKGGILVRDLTTLKQVIPSRKSIFSNKFPGLHPTIVANIDGIKVLLDRQKLYEDALLHHFVDYCENALNRISLELIKQIFPMDMRNRYHLAISKLRRSHLVYGALVLLLIALPLIIRLQPPRPKPLPLPIATEQARSLDFLMEPWDASLIDPPSPQINRWDFTYQGEQRLLFRVRTFDEFDPKDGLRVAPIDVLGDYPNLTIPSGQVVKVRMGVNSSGRPQVLPLPPNHAVFADNVRIQGQLQKVMRSQFNEPVIIPDRTGLLTYETGASVDQTEPMSYPRVEWPRFFEPVLDEAREKSSPAERVALVTAFCRENLKYAREAEVANLFMTGEGTWLQRVARIRSGDCDVLNGTLVMLLRELDIPAVLCGGLVGDKGVIQSDLHAWVYYYVDGWNTLDLTPGAPTPSAESVEPPRRAAGGATGLSGARPSSSTQSRRVGLYTAIGLALVLMYLWLRKTREPRMDPKQVERCLEEMIHSYLSSPDVIDPLQLRYRPAIPLLGGKRISLHQLSVLARQGPILGGTKHLPILGQLEVQQPIVNLSGKGTNTLFRYFPMMIHLRDLEAILRTDPLPDYLQVAESMIQRHDPDFRLHLIEGRAMHEITLRLRNIDLGSRHLLLGRDHRLYKRLHRLQGQPALLIVHALVARTTFFQNSACELLEKIAEEGPNV